MVIIVYLVNKIIEVMFYQEKIQLMPILLLVLILILINVLLLMIVVVIKRWIVMITRIRSKRRKRTL